MSIEEITTREAIEELETMLESFIEYRRDIKRRIFIRKKTRQLCLTWNKNETNALTLAIKTLQNQLKDA